jgi:cation transport regulator ChaC
MDTITIFGFGSLINLESLKATAPDAFGIRACYIKGFRRDFSLWNPIGWHKTNLDLAGEAFCALDVKSHSEPEARVNGIIFRVSEASYKRLIKRERGYSLVKTTAYCFESDEKVGECFVFSANKNDGTYNFDSKAQQRYLEVCLEGARLYGEPFYREFLDRAFIDGRQLAEISELAEI